MKKSTLYITAFVTGLLMITPQNIQADTIVVEPLTEIAQEITVDETIEIETVTEVGNVVLSKDAREKQEQEEILKVTGPSISAQKAAQEIEEALQRQAEEEAAIAAALALANEKIEDREEIVALAYSLIGSNYRWGGTSTNGFDCSGFTQYVMTHAADVSLPRTSQSQSNVGESISAEQMQPGDLLFYASGSSVNHVAIYVGNGQIVHASTESTGVKISQWNYRNPIRIKNVVG